MSEVGSLLKPTLKYLKKKGLPLFLIALVPSVLMSFMISPASMMYFFSIFHRLPAYDFSTMALKIFGFDNPFWWLGIVGILLFVFFLALMFGIIDRHMRVGEFSLSPKLLFSRLNFNFMTALKFAFFALLIFEIYNLLNLAFCLLWAQSFDNSFTAAMLFSIITFFVLSFILLFSFTSVIMWPPFQLHLGMSTFQSMKMAVRQNGENAIRIGFIMLLFLMPFAFIMIPAAKLNWPFWARIILDSLSLATAVTVYITMMYITFFEVTGTERVDLQNTDIWKKK